MPGGIVFTVTAVNISDQWGNPVICTLCGGGLWDITLKGGDLDRVECSDSDCGQPATVEDSGAYA